jgi:membrane peptidoglycan carboxypeptidase
MSSRDVPRQIGMLAVLSVVAGLLVAGLALPVVAGVGWASHTTEDALNDFPSELDQPPLAQHSVLRAADGTVIATLAGAEDRVVVPLSAVPIVMQQAIVAIEDNRFYEHKGVDVRSILRAAKTDSNSDGYTQGASTITQQYVKEVLLELATNSNATPAEKKEAQKEATEKSIGRKLREARYAIALEQKLTKAQILERYLNIAYFGQGVYGIGTAAEHYFNEPVQKLTLAQSALLAGIVNSPTQFDPSLHPQAALDRRNTVLAAVQKYGYQPAAVVQAAVKTPVVVHPVTKVEDSCSTSVAPVFCSYVVNKLLADPKLGPEAVYEGGLNIYTTLDLHTQQSVDAGIAKNVSYGTRQVTSVVSMQPGTGRILAIGQNQVYGSAPGQSKAIYADQHSYNVGSTFKAVTLATALSQGLPTSTTYNSPPCLKGFGYESNTSSKRCPGGVTNAGDSEGGIYNMVNGTWDSVNTYFVQLEHTVGIDNVRQMAVNLGNLSPFVSTNGADNASLTLGAASSSPIDMATMYATLDAHGEECDPRFIDKITTSAGAPVPFTQSAPCREAIPASVADGVTSLLQGVLTSGPAAGRGIGRPAAGKTGTLDDATGAWFIGYVPQLVTAVGVFDPKAPGGTIAPMTDLRTGATYSENTLFGGTIPAYTWQSVMEQAVSTLPVEYFARPAAASPAAPSTSATTSPSGSPSGTPSGTPSGPAGGGSPGPPVGSVLPTIPVPPPAH